MWLVEEVVSFQTSFRRSSLTSAFLRIKQEFQVYRVTASEAMQRMFIQSHGNKI